MHRLTGLWIPFVALAATWMLCVTSPFIKLDLWVTDATQRLTAKDDRFRDTVVIDIDDASLEKLRPQFGGWPYSRDVYAFVLDWLVEHDASAVVFDILFADPRDKDEIFAASLKKYGNGVLIAISQSQGAATDTKRRTHEFAWQAPDMPGPRWRNVTLPAASLTSGLADRGQISLAAAHEDEDGVLRRLPLIHWVDDVALPSPALAAMLRPGMARQVNHNPAGRLAIFGTHSWPVDAEGTVRIAFPGNTDAILSMPFSQVAEAALGMVKLDEAKTFFAGKTVFIGSTAHLSDRVNTPRGVLTGTTMLALGHQSLMHDRLLVPRNILLDGLLAGLALLLLTVVAVDLIRHDRLAQAIPLLGIPLLGALHLSLMAASRESSLLIPVTLLIIGGLLMAARRFHRLSQVRDQLAYAASTDTLTGLLLRRAFLERFAEEIERSRRHGNPLTIAILDLDHFKRVNDTYGHPVGDLVLKVFAGTLRECLRSIDIAGRWGGEEFVVLLPSTSVQDAIAVLERVRIAISEKSFPPPANDLHITMSAGVVALDGTSNDPEQIVGAADTALYEAKESGRNRICVRAARIAEQAG